MFFLLMYCYLLFQLSYTKLIITVLHNKIIKFPPKKPTQYSTRQNTGSQQAKTLHTDSQEPNTLIFTLADNKPKT